MLLRSLIDKWLQDYADVFTIKYCKLGVRLDYITGNVNWYVHINVPPSVWSVYTYHYNSIPSLNLPFLFSFLPPSPSPPHSSPLPLLTCSLTLSTMCCISDSWVGTVWKRSRPAWSVAVSMQVRNTSVLAFMPLIPQYSSAWWPSWWVYN